MMAEEEHQGIVIVGGGICGLAIALALHRKGIKSLVLEKCDALPSEGLAIGIPSNGWRALDRLGVGPELRTKTTPLTGIRDEWLHKNGAQVIPCRDEEFRFLKRRDLIETLANNLPVDSIRFGCHVVAVETENISTFPIVYFRDGSIIKTKVLIGCDGSNSVVAKSLGLAHTKLYSICGILGFTRYPNGHLCENYLLKMMSEKITFGRVPIDNKLVHWFVGRPCSSQDSEIRKDHKLIRDTTLALLHEYPTELTNLVKNCDLDSVVLTSIRYRAPWHLLSGNLWRGTTTVAGDAMHVIGAFLGQGSSAALEDAVVLARCLAREMGVGMQGEISDQELRIRIGTGLCSYVKERRLRLLRLSMHSYVLGLVITSTSLLKKLIALVILIVFFGVTGLSASGYDCGRL